MRESNERAAQDPNTPAERLRALYQEHPSLHPLLAQNPSCPPDLLVLMADRIIQNPLLPLVGANPNTPLQTLYRVWAVSAESFLENPAVALLQLEFPQFWSAMPSATLLALLYRDRLDPLVLDWALRRNDDKLLAMVVKHPQATPALLSKALHQEKGRLPPVRIDIANHPKVSMVVLELLYGDPILDVRRAALQNPSLDPFLRELGRKLPSLFLSDEDASLPSLSDDELYRLARCGPAVKRFVASYPTCPESLLLVLALGWGHPLCEGLEAENPARASALKMCGKTSEPERALLISTRPALSLRLQESLLECSCAAARAQLASRADIEVELLCKLAKDRSDEVRAAATKNEKLPISVLSAQSQDTSCLVRVAAIRPGLDEASMAALLHDKRDEVKETLAQSPCTPPALLASLLTGDVTPKIRALTAKNPNTPPEVLAQLRRVEGPNPTEEDLAAYSTGTWFMRGLAVNHPRAPLSLLERFVCSPDRAERVLAAASKGASIEQLERLSIDKESTVREAIAQNPKTPAHLLEALSRDEDKWVRRYTARHPSTPAHVLRAFAELPLSENYPYELAKNPALPEELFSKILLKGQYFLQRDLLVNPATPRAILLEITGRLSNYSDDLVLLAKHPNAPLEAFTKLGDRCPKEALQNKEVLALPTQPKTLLKSLPVAFLRLLALQKETPPALLRWLSSHSHGEILVALAKSPSTPKDVLALLAESTLLKVKRALKSRKLAGY